MERLLYLCPCSAKRQLKNWIFFLCSIYSNPEEVSYETVQWVPSKAKASDKQKAGGTAFTLFSLSKETYHSVVEWEAVMAGSSSREGSVSSFVLYFNNVAKEKCTHIHTCIFLPVPAKLRNPFTFISKNDSIHEAVFLALIPLLYILSSSPNHKLCNIN